MSFAIKQSNKMVKPLGESVSTEKSSSNVLDMDFGFSDEKTSAGNQPAQQATKSGGLSIKPTKTSTADFL